MVLIYINETTGTIMYKNIPSSNDFYWLLTNLPTAQPVTFNDEISPKEEIEGLQRVIIMKEEYVFSSEDI
jgi:hypothetical protein